MKRIISIIGACTLLATAAFGVCAAEQEPILRGTATVSYDSPELADYAEQVAVLVNQERAENGLQPVKFSPLLSEAANVRSSELKDSFSHTRPDGTSCFTVIDELGISYRAAAENIAYGQRTPESVMNAWMNSSGHRANILNKNMEYIGVGVVYLDGIYYWTQLFAASDALSDGAYLPGDDANQPAVTTTVSETTVQTTTTAALSSTTAPITTEQTASTEAVTTEQVTTTVPQTTSAETTFTTTTEPITTTQTSVCTTTTTEEATTTCMPETTTNCIEITKPVFTLPVPENCPVIGGGALIIISPK